MGEDWFYWNLDYLDNASVSWDFSASQRGMESLKIYQTTECILKINYVIEFSALKIAFMLKYENSDNQDLNKVFT